MFRQPTKHRPLFLVTCLTWLALLGTAAHAQSTGGLAQAARSEAERGIRAFAAADYRAAAAAFQRADQLHPNPAFVYDTGRAYEELHATERALHFYREYLRRAPAAKDRAEAETRITRLEKLQRGPRSHKVWLRSRPAGATVWIDTEPVGKTPLALDLAGGAHRATFRLPGHRPQAVHFELQPGQRTLHVEANLPLEGDSVSDGAFAPRAPEASTQGLDPRRSRSSPVLRSLGFGAMLASVTALGGAVALEVMRADSERAAVQDREQLRAAQSAAERAQTQKTWSRVFAGVGGGLGALGITLLVLSRDKTEDRPTSRVALHCAPTKCRAELSGVF